MLWAGSALVVLGLVLFVAPRLYAHFDLDLELDDATRDHVRRHRTPARNRRRVALGLLLVGGGLLLVEAARRSL